MFKIVVKQSLGENVTLYEVEAPRVARRHRAGQFVMVRPHGHSERIPLTIADVDPARGTITLVVQAVGKTTIEMAEAFAQGDSFSQRRRTPRQPDAHRRFPERSEDFRGTVACVAGGIGAAPMLPIARAFRDAGHEVVTILGARRKDLLVFEDRLGAASSELLDLHRRRLLRPEGLRHRRAEGRDRDPSRERGRRPPGDRDRPAADDEVLLEDDAALRRSDARFA